MTDQERDQFAELKTFAWAAPLVLPMIQKRQKNALELLLSDFRGGKVDNLARVAELNAYYAIEMELKQKQEEFRTLEERYATRK